VQPVFDKLREQHARNEVISNLIDLVESYVSVIRKFVVDNKRDGAAEWFMRLKEMQQRCLKEVNRPPARVIVRDLVRGDKVVVDTSKFKKIGKIRLKIITEAISLAKRILKQRNWSIQF
jgi:hypothetical protein